MQETNNKSGYYHRSAGTIRLLKYATIFLFVFFLISCIVIFRKDITIQNIQLLAKFISFDSSSEQYSEQFTTTANNESDVFMLRNNLGVVNHNNISLYDLSGQKLFSYNFSLSTPAVVHDNHNIIVHDIEGNNLTVFNSFSKIKDFKFTGEVLASDIVENFFCVITRDETYTSLLKVYEYSYHERDYLERFTLKSSSHLTSCAISQNGRYLVVSSTDSKEGSYNSNLSVYDTTSSSTSPLHSYTLSGELPIKVGISSDNNTFFAITDSTVSFFNAKNNEPSVYKFNQSKVDSYYKANGMIIITEKNNLSGNSVLLTALDEHGGSLFEINLPDIIYDITIGKEKIFALGKSKVYEISKDKDDKYLVSATADVRAKHFAIVSDTDDNCYILDDSYVSKVTF